MADRCIAILLIAVSLPNSKLVLWAPPNINNVPKLDGFLSMTWVSTNSPYQALLRDMIWVSQPQRATPPQWGHHRNGVATMVATGPGRATDFLGRFDVHVVGATASQGQNLHPLSLQRFQDPQRAAAAAALRRALGFKVAPCALHVRSELR